jgi:hypothetical protein
MFNFKIILDPKSNPDPKFYLPIRIRPIIMDPSGSGLKKLFISFIYYFLV